MIDGLGFSEQLALVISALAPAGGGAFYIAHHRGTAPPGVALAWILIVTIVPVLGLIGYFLVGERPIGRDRTKRIDKARPVYQRMTALLDARYPDAEHQIAPSFSPWRGSPRTMAACPRYPATA